MPFRKKVGLLLVGLASGFLVSCARVPVKPPPPPPEGKIRGTVVPQDLAVPLEGAVARIGEVETTVTSGGAFIFFAAPEGKQSVIVEKRFPSGKVRRILGIAVVYISENPVEIKVRVRDATDVDNFCLDCHPPLGKVTRKDQIFRDVHISGVVAKSAMGDPGLLDPEGKITCESCHTPHRPGGFPFFGVGNLKSGLFCNRCHGSRK